MGGCAKIDLKAILGSILASPADTFFEKRRFRAESVRHGTFADAHSPRKNLVFEKSIGRVCQNQPKIAPGGVLGLRAPTCRFSEKNVFGRFLEHFGDPGGSPKPIKNVFFRIFFRMRFFGMFFSAVGAFFRHSQRFLVIFGPSEP